MVEKQFSESSPLIQNDDNAPPEPKKSFYQRHKCLTISCSVFLFFTIFLILFAAFAVPPIARNMMQKMLDDAVLTVQEAELVSQDGNKFKIRIAAVLTYDAPIEVDGVSDPTALELLIENPLNREELLLSGVVNLPSLSSTGTRTEFNVTCDLEITSDSAVHVFLGDILISNEIAIWGRGVVNVTAYVPIYKSLSLTATMLKRTTIKGFADMDFSLNYMDLINATENDVNINFDIAIHNPSIIFTNFPIQIYSQDLGLYYRDVWIGHCEPDNITVGRTEQANKIIGTLVRTPENEPYVAEFLSEYILGRFLLIYVKGTAKVDVGLGRSDENPADIYIKWLLPGIQDQLIQDISCPLDEVEPIRLILSAEGKMFNPLNFPVSLLQVEFDAYVAPPCDRIIGRIDESWDDPFVFPSKQPVCLGGLSLKITLADLTCMTAAIPDLSLSALNGSMRMAVDLFQIQIPFNYGPIAGRLGKCSV